MLWDQGLHQGQRHFLFLEHLQSLAALETWEHSHLCPTFPGRAKPRLAITQVWGHQFSCLSKKGGKGREEPPRHGKVKCLRRGSMAHQWRSWHSSTGVPVFYASAKASRPPCCLGDHTASVKCVEIRRHFPRFLQGFFLLFHTWLTAVRQNQIAEVFLSL